MVIRDYQPGDYPAVYDLWKSLEMYPDERGDTPETIQATLEKQGARLLLLEWPEKNLLIGTSWMTCDGRRIYLHHFGIRESFQQKGLGRKLAEASISHIRKTGMQVKLEVHHDNIPAKRLYESMGFFAYTDYDIYMLRDFMK